MSNRNRELEINTHGRFAGEDEVVAVDGDNARRIFSV